MEMSRYIERLTPKAEYLETLATSRDILQGAGLNPLYVGGVIAKAIPLHAIDRLQIDHAKRTVVVPIDSDAYTAMRKDKTYDDFDIIVDHPDQSHVESTVAEMGYSLQQQGLTNHFVSTEAVRYPDWKPRNKLLQMVSGIDVDPDGNTRFTFGHLASPPIPKETMEPWEYIYTENGKEVITLPSFNPAFIGLRYLMRLPVSRHGGLRKKDTFMKVDEETGKKTSKIHTLMKLRERALATAQEQGVQYDSEAWRAFIIRLQQRSHQDRLTRAKGDFLNFYWTDLAPISTAFVHGAGIFKEIAKLGNKFGG